jgi:hypothetical protein
MHSLITNEKALSHTVAEDTYAVLYMNLKFHCQLKLYPQMLNSNVIMNHDMS